MPECILAMDAGGTSIKHALMRPSGEPVASCAQEQTPTERAGRAQVLQAFAQSAQRAAAQAQGLGLRITRVGVCCPGPFDFARGMSRMTHKWQDAYERPIAPVISAVLGDCPVDFLHDSSAYILGEGLLGAGRGEADVAGVMLGTGFGFGYMRAGRVQTRPDQGPWLTLWNRPFREGIVEDYVSRRAIRARYAGLGGDAAADVREIAHRAEHGDGQAAQAFAQTGALLGEILAEALAGKPCGRVVLGGQIARAAHLMLPHMQKAPAPVCVAEHLEDAALRGIALYCARGHAAVMEERG